MRIRLSVLIFFTLLKLLNKFFLYVNNLFFLCFIVKSQSNMQNFNRTIISLIVCGFTLSAFRRDFSLVEYGMLAGNTMTGSKGFFTAVCW